MNEAFGDSWRKEVVPASPSLEELENEINVGIENLPPELALAWEKRLTNADNQSLLGLAAELRETLSKRRTALAPNPPRLFRPDSKHLLESAEKIEEAVSRIAALEGRAELFLGEGQRGHVYADPEAPGTCYKFIFKPRNYEEWNSVGKEAEFLETLEDFEVDGVKTPKLHALIDRQDIKVITMERIDGENIKQTIEKKRDLPLDFDIDAFFTKLGAYIEQMHRKYNIYHRDLHAGNILIGRDGSPYVIDFGKAMFSPNEDWAYEITNRAGQHESVLVSDEEHLKAAKSQLRQYMRERAQDKLTALTKEQ